MLIFTKDHHWKQEINREGKHMSIKAGERIVGCRRLNWLKLKGWHASIGASCQRPAGPHRWNWNCSAVLQFRDLLPTRYLIPPYHFFRALYFFRLHPLVSIPLERGLWRGLGLCFISYPISAVYLQPGIHLRPVKRDVQLCTIQEIGLITFFLGVELNVDCILVFMHCFSFLI